MLDIVNYYEHLVVEQLWVLAINEKETSFSHSDIEDIACLALNNLPTCYVRSVFDKSLHFSETEYEVVVKSVKKAIFNAIKQVKVHPHLVRET